MGQIKQDVREIHLAQFPAEEALLKPFLSGFDVTWARRRRAYNTELSTYFLLPEPFISQRDYFWTTIKQSYPELWDALQRVKIYRHCDLHLELTRTTQAEHERYIELDLEGRRVSQVPDVWFVLQQSVLDGLLLGVQCELNRCS